MFRQIHILPVLIDTEQENANTDILSARMAHILTDRQTGEY